MIRLAFVSCCVVFLAGAAWAAKPTRFWNLTGFTVTELYMAPAGTDQYGKDLTKSDKDGSVDHDERLKLPDLKSGSYDLKLKDAKGRMCSVKNVAVKEGDVFSIEAKDLACQP